MLVAPATALAAPWSFELPAGYTEQIGAGDSYAATLGNMSHTVSADVQVYLSADGNVRLTRTLWTQKPDDPPTKQSVEATDRNLVSGAALVDAKHISDSRRFVGDLLVADCVDEKSGVRVVQHRLIAADTSNLVHVFTVMCSAAVGTPMTECEQAQQTMQLDFPTRVALRDEPGPSEGAALAQQIIFGVLILSFVVWLVVRRRRAA